jgi:hypothetical protein
VILCVVTQIVTDLTWPSIRPFHTLSIYDHEPLASFVRAYGLVALGGVQQHLCRFGTKPQQFRREIYFTFTIGWYIFDAPF